MLNTQTHLINKQFGSGGSKRRRDIAEILEEGGFKSVLDYGCGKGTLRTSMLPYCVDKNIEFREYDPAIPGKDNIPEPADLVVCADVLEHVEPQFVDGVLSHLYRLTNRALYAIVVFQKSTDVMSDGSQAHISLMTEAQWLTRMAQAGFMIDCAEITSNKKSMTICVRK